MRFTPHRDATVIEPMRFNLLTDVGGLQPYYAFVGAAGDVLVTNDAAAATPASIEEPEVETPGLGLVSIGLVALALAARKRP